MRVILSAFVAGVLISACTHSIIEVPPEATPGRALGPGEQWVPVAPNRYMNGVPLLCAGTGWAGGGYVLAGSPGDPRLVWMIADGRQELEWPVGYSARFTPDLELPMNRASWSAAKGPNSQAAAKWRRACGMGACRARTHVFLTARIEDSALR